MRKIPFNIPFVAQGSKEAVITAMENHDLAGGGFFAKRCQSFLRKKLDAEAVFMTPSCTSALEMAALILDIKPGDEVIVPSFTFVTSVSAFVLRGAIPIFADIQSSDLTIDPLSVQNVITDRTKAIIAVDYAGNICNMRALRKIADDNSLFLVEDAAQALGATRRGSPLGGFSDIAAISFHSTKNIGCGEGGALVLKNQRFVRRAEIIQEKGTNRAAFLRGQIDRYSWVSLGSSFLMSELQSSFLSHQLYFIDEVTNERRKLWGRYYENFSNSPVSDLLDLPKIDDDSMHNGHIFYLVLKVPGFRDSILAAMRDIEISLTTHYEPLHKSKYYEEVYRQKFNLPATDDVVANLIRFPMYYGLRLEDIDFICDKFSEMCKVFIK
jgi:dTDP-4-amino-4,6-dideoxygalactose transaminase